MAPAMTLALGLAIALASTPAITLAKHGLGRLSCHVSAARPTSLHFQKIVEIWAS
jgi:hypothetical protein